MSALVVADSLTDRVFAREILLRQCLIDHDNSVG